MKVVKDLSEVDRIDFVVLTGDGKWEFRVLKGLESRIRCDLVIFFPESPLAKKTGKSVYKAIPVYVSKYKICKFLVILDREHHKSFDEDLRILKNINVKVSNHCELIKDRVLHISGKLGSHDVIIYTCIQGNMRLNDEIKKLIEAQFSVKLKSDDHGVIRKFLESKNLDITELIKTANPKNLGYLTIYLALKEICKNIKE